LVKTALEKTEVAAIGPVVADALTRHDVRVRFMPQDSFFMKPLASAIEEEIGPGS
jgi:uroporphyrinogen-III synthase